MAVVDYESAGVNISAGNEVVSRIKSHVHQTYNKNVIGQLGGFGGMYDLSDITAHYQKPVMVQSIDGVGTKTIVARMMKKYDTLGQDILSATSNDILVLGAKPLTLLDYVANDQLDPDIVTSFVEGLSQACIEHGVALVGGETAEMPNTYLPGEHDIVGVITGVVEKDKIINGESIKAGDKIFGFASNGLHTNGYSLARKLCFDIAGYDIADVGEELLKPHINYQRPVLAMLDAGINIKGMAHITGGGLVENIPRVLPDGLSFQLKKDSWPSLPIFDLLQEIGNISPYEMQRTFNMGIGYVLIGDASIYSELNDVLLDYPDFQLYDIGEVTT